MIPTTPGLHEIDLTVGEHSQSISISLPNLPAGQHPPLVIALHYAGHAGQRHYATGYLAGFVQPALASLGAVILAPDCPDASWETERAEEAVLGLIDLAVTSWGVDPKRVVLTGYSMGAVGAWRLAERHPERFSVLVPIAGRPQGVDTLRVPTYAIHGTADALFPADAVERATETLRARSIDAHYTPGPGFGHYEMARYIPLLRASVPWLTQHLAPR